MIEPGTAILIASALAAGAKGAGDYAQNQSAKKQAKRRAKETKRETYANMLEEAENRNAELAAHGLASRQKLGKRRANASNETAELVRGALTI